MKHPLLVLVLVFSFAFTSATGQSKSRLLQRLDSLLNNLNPIAVPTIQNSPETNWNFGAGITYYFNTEPNHDTLTPTRSSSLVATFNYSLRQQLQTEMRWLVFSKDEQMFYRGSINYADFFDKFWGIGNNTSAQNQNELSYKRVQIQANVLRKVSKNVFLGGSYQFSSFKDINWYVKADNLQLAELRGSTGSRVSGIGPIVIADFRDNPYSARRGYYAEFSTVYYRAGLGSSHTFDEYFVDLRHYQTLFKTHVLAFQGVGNFLSGDVPFREQARLGGQQIMRGYFNGRFTDQNLLAVQAEYRMPIYKKWACSFFASTGQVAAQLNDFAWSQNKLAYGAGLRFLLNAKERAYVRFDFAYTTDNTFGFYIRVADSF